MVKVINIDTVTKTIRIGNADGDIKTWRTTESGTHFPIREGESTKEALDKFLEKKGKRYYRGSVLHKDIIDDLGKASAKSDENVKYWESEVGKENKRKRKTPGYLDFAQKNIEAWKAQAETQRAKAKELSGDFEIDPDDADLNKEFEEWKKSKQPAGKSDDIMSWPFNKVMELPDDDPRLEKYLKAHHAKWKAAKENDKIEALKDKVVDGIAGDVGSQDYTQLVSSELDKELAELEKNSGDKEPAKSEPASKPMGADQVKQTMQKTMESFPKLYSWEKPHLEKFADDIWSELEKNPGKEQEILDEWVESYDDAAKQLGMWVDTPTLVKRDFVKKVAESWKNNSGTQAQQPAKKELTEKDSDDRQNKIESLRETRQNILGQLEKMRTSGGGRTMAGEDTADLVDDLKRVNKRLSELEQDHSTQTAPAPEKSESTGDVYGSYENAEAIRQELWDKGYATDNEGDGDYGDTGTEYVWKDGTMYAVDITKNPDGSVSAKQSSMGEVSRSEFNDYLDEIHGDDDDEDEDEEDSDISGIESRADAAEWLNAMTRKHGNTYFWSGNMKSALNKLVQKFGNTYFWNK